MNIDVHTYVYIYNICMIICKYILFRIYMQIYSFSESIICHYKMLNIVPCATQSLIKETVFYVLYILVSFVVD